MPTSTRIATGVDAVRIVAAAAPPFNPLTVFGADLQLWFDAGDETTQFQDVVGGIPANDADPVGAWADKSGKLDAGVPRHATQGTASAKPTRNDSLSPSVLTFDGGDRLVTPVFTLETVPTTLVIVGAATGNNQAYVDGAAPRTILQRGASVTTIIIHNGASLTTAAASPDLSVRRAVMGEFNGASSVARINNTQVAAGNAGTAGTTNLSIGGIAGVLIVGEICEVIFVGRLMTAQERTDLQAYLAGKWSL